MSIFSPNTSPLDLIYREGNNGETIYRKAPKHIEETQMMIRRSLMLIVLLGCTMPVAAFAQFKDAEPQGVKMGDSKTFRWRAGMTISAVGGACKGITGYAPVPTDWPEQQVRIVEEDISAEAKVDYRIIDGTVKVMTVKDRQLGAGQEAKALVTLEIKRRPILPPDEVDIYVLPDAKKLRPRSALIYRPARRSKAAIRKSAARRSKSSPTRKRHGIKSRRFTIGCASM